MTLVPREDKEAASVSTGRKEPVPRDLREAAESLVGGTLDEGKEERTESGLDDLEGKSCWLKVSSSGILS